MRGGLRLLALLALLGAARPALADAGTAGLAFRPHPGARLPLLTELSDAHGRGVTLARYFTGKPVILLLEYLRCKDLCGVILNNLAAALDRLPIDAGRGFQLVVVSIDPRDTPADAAAAKKKYFASYHHPGVAEGVHFLTGPAASVRRIADAIGFPYRYDAAAAEYVHPAGFVVASPDGRISRYFLGVAVRPARLRAGLADAAAGRSLGPLTRILLFCHLGPVGRYTVPILAAFSVANVAATAGLLGVFVAIRRRRHR